ncbi:hypothetical protein ES703_38201 [subsurface metagenome]
MAEIKQDIRTATFVVAADDSIHKNMADYVCTGVNDHVEIQAAINALPATGGEVFLLDGTYYIEASLGLDSYQTLRGCGRNTILTTTTADLDIIVATGGAGTEKVGILIADLCVDGNAGGAVNDVGILWTYVDYSSIYNVWSLNNGERGIELSYSDYNRIENNTCQGNSTDGIKLDESKNNIIAGNTSQGNTQEGIELTDSDNNTISDNICQGNNSHGIDLDSSNGNAISGNVCQGNGNNGIALFTSANNNTIANNNCSGNDVDGIFLTGTDNNTVSDNICQLNGARGIHVDALKNNTIIGNTFILNSQGADNTHDNIFLAQSDYNLIEGNLCRAPTIGTTLTVGEPIAETEIAVADTTGFEVGMGVVFDLGNGSGTEEYHRIVAITAGAPGVIVIEVGLTFIQAVGENIDVPEARYGINISNATCDKNVIIGNDLYNSGKTANFNDVGTLTMVRDDNRNIDVIQVRHYIYVKNTSGSQRVAGDVVIIKGIATDIEFTTTVTQGDDKVYGMVAETIEDDASGYVLVKGFTADLKVDGTIDIAIDDILGTFTTACIAMKAAAGDQGFALALEVYAADDSNGVIDAYIKSPWD